MPINLDDPIDWQAPTEDEQAMLADLQGNILKGHGRHATLNLFVRLGDDQEAARLMIRRLGVLTISALDQLHMAATFKRARNAGRPTGHTPTFFSVMLGRSAYERLGVAAPADEAFEQGMRHRAALLSDVDDKLDAEWRQRPDLMILIADDPDGEQSWQSTLVNNAETLVTSIVTSHGGEILFRQPGRAIFRTQPDGCHEGIEHFGYVDGRSQPLFLKEQVAEEEKAQWDPSFPPRQLLVADPGSTGGRGFGSFFVFRKLEQNVAAFKEAEDRLKNLEGADGIKLGEVAGAMLVGRFEDGTPVTLKGKALDRGDGRKCDPRHRAEIPNDFTYAEDMKGLRCPFHAHIRKTNPRGDLGRLNLGSEAAERKHIMARRGITYGVRDTPIDPSDKPDEAPIADVGLLFMAYNSDIAEQFEFTQQSWANNPEFAPGLKKNADPDLDPGLDPVIGQRGASEPKPGDPERRIAVRHQWDCADANVERIDFKEYITFKGGDYFFAPARSTLLSM